LINRYLRPEPSKEESINWSSHHRAGMGFCPQEHLGEVIYRHVVATNSAKTMASASIIISPHRAPAPAAVAFHPWDEQDEEE
jgi:hypothetical protein